MSLRAFSFCDAFIAFMTFIAFMGLAAAHNTFKASVATFAAVSNVFFSSFNAFAACVASFVAFIAFLDFIAVMLESDMVVLESMMLESVALGFGGDGIARVLSQNGYNNICIVNYIICVVHHTICNRGVFEIIAAGFVGLRWDGRWDFWDGLRSMTITI